MNGWFRFNAITLAPKHGIEASLPNRQLIGGSYISPYLQLSLRVRCLFY